MSRQASAPRVTVAGNNGDLGGGEVMQLLLVEALRDLGLDASAAGPAEPPATAREAERRGLRFEAVPASGRAQYLLGLRRWDRTRTGLLWCNGLRPGLATVGRADRVLHLHRLPDRSHLPLLRASRAGARAVVVPSAMMARRVRGSVQLSNWTEDVPFEPRTWEALGATRPLRIGFLGRMTVDKGILVLAAAVHRLRQAGSSVRLVLAGESRFVDKSERVSVEHALAPLGDVTARLGWTAREDFFDAVDLAVFPSTWEEPFGLVAAEAMAAGVPFVVSDAGALPEVAGPAHPWVARAGDVEDLVATLRRAMSSTSIERGRAVEQARHRWEREFSPVAGRTRLAALLRNLGLLPRGLA